MIKIQRKQERKDREYGEPFQEGDENNTVPNSFEKIFQNTLENSEKRLR